MNQLKDETIEGLIQAIKQPYIEQKIIDIKNIHSNSILFINYVYKNQQIFKILVNIKYFPNFEKELQERLLEVNKMDVTIHDEIIKTIDKKIFFTMNNKALIGV